MKNNIDISVILPVYNVEAWVGRAAESLQKQTLTNFEAWFVDDGSPDNSGKICDEISKNDKRFHVIHQNNKGAAEARNAALPKTSGKYLYFMDPDDWCEKNMLEDMFNEAEKHKLELLIVGYYVDTYYDTEKYHTATNKPDYNIFSSQKEFREATPKLYDGEFLSAPWNKLYLREYIIKNNLTFPDTFWDDFPFNVSVIKNINKVGCLNRAYYHFLKARSDAETAKFRPEVYEKHEEECQWLEDLYKYWKMNDDNTKEFLAKRYTERLIASIENIASKACKYSNKEKRKIIKNIISSDRAKHYLKIAKQSSLAMKCCVVPLKMNSATITLWEGKFISYIMHKHVNIFAKILSKR